MCQGDFHLHQRLGVRSSLSNASSPLSWGFHATLILLYSGSCKFYTLLYCRHFLPSSPLSGDLPTMQLLTGGSPISHNALLKTRPTPHNVLEGGPAHSTHCSTKVTWYLVPCPTRRLLLHTLTLGIINTSCWTLSHRRHSTHFSTRTLPALCTGYERHFLLPNSSIQNTPSVTHCAPARTLPTPHTAEQPMLPNQTHCTWDADPVNTQL